MNLKGLFNARWPKVALFDLDGTLVDSAPDLAMAVDQMLVQLGRTPAGLEQVRNWVGNGAAVLVKRALAGRTDWQLATPENEALFERALALFFQAYKQHNGRHAVVYPGVLACLEQLSQHGCRLAVVTNKPDAFVGPLLAQLSLADYFEASVAGDTLPVKKPDPAPLMHAMEALDGTPGTTVMVGDSAADVQAAQAAHLPCVAVRYGYNFGQPVERLGADAVVDSLAELL